MINFRIFTKLSLITILICLSLFIPSSYSFLQGDIDGDDQIGLKEGINALQVTAGMRSATATKTIYVPADFQKIQDAIDAASAGDTIEVSAGTYQETLMITKDGISLRGASRDNTIIEGNGTTDVITVSNARQIHISGFLIRSGKHGIYASYSSLECDNLRIENNLYGLRARRNSYVSVGNTIVKQNTDYYAVRVDMGAAAVFVNCKIIQNAGGNGLYVKQNAVVVATNCKFSENGDNGISANLGATIEVEGCEINNNAHNGVLISNNSIVSLQANPTTFVNSKIEGNGGYGISCNNNQTSFAWGGLTFGTNILGNTNCN